MGSNPGWTKGVVPSAEEWDALWASKRDEGDGTFGNLSVSGGVALNGAAGNLSFPAARAWAGTSLENNPLITQSITWTGSNPGVLQSAANWFLHYDRMDSNTAPGSGFSVLHPYVYVGGPGKVGQTNAVDISLVFDATSGNVGPTGVYGGLRVTVQASANDHGTTVDPTTYRSGLYATNFVSELLPGATAWSGLTSCEFDYGIYTGASSLDKVGVSITTLALDRVAGVRDDAMLAFAAQAAQGVAVGAKVALAIGTKGGFFPLAASGAIMRAFAADGIMNLTDGIDIEMINFTGFSLKVPNFKVASTGYVSMNADVGGYSATLSKGLFLGGTVAGGADVLISAVNGANIVINPQGAGIIKGQSAATFVGNVRTDAAFLQGATQVLTSRQHGWVLPTGTLARNSFDPATATLTVVAQHLAALITDGMTHGYIGA